MAKFLHISISKEQICMDDKMLWNWYKSCFGVPGNWEPVGIVFLLNQKMRPEKLPQDHKKLFNYKLFCNVYPLLEQKWEN